MFTTFIILITSYLSNPNISKIEDNLNDPEWSIRERTEKYLIYLALTNNEYYPLLKEKLNRSEYQEVRLRMQTSQITSNSLRYQWAVNTANAHWQDYPYLDSIFYDVEMKQYSYANFPFYATLYKNAAYNYIYRAGQDSKLTPDDTRGWPQYRVATRRAVIDAIYRGMDIDEINKFLLQLHAKDYKMCRDKQMSWYSTPDIMVAIGGEVLQSSVPDTPIPEMIPPAP